jgi:hypothetical protein
MDQPAPKRAYVDRDDELSVQGDQRQLYHMSLIATGQDPLLEREVGTAQAAELLPRRGEVQDLLLADVGNDGHVQSCVLEAMRSLGEEELVGVSLDYITCLLREMVTHQVTDWESAFIATNKLLEQEDIVTAPQGDLWAIVGALGNHVPGPVYDLRLIPRTLGIFGSREIDQFYGRCGTFVADFGGALPR